MAAKKKEENIIWIIAGLAALLFLFARKSSGKIVDVTGDFVIEAYRDLITVSADNLTYQGVPLHVYLARNTFNYDAVKDSYNSTYGGNFTLELTSKLAGPRLAEYVSELLKNGQVIIP